MKRFIVLEKLTEVALHFSKEGRFILSQDLSCPITTFKNIFEANEAIKKSVSWYRKNGDADTTSDYVVFPTENYSISLYRQTSKNRLPEINHSRTKVKL